MLEGVYLSKTGSFRKGHNTLYLRICSSCGQECLVPSGRTTSFCSKSCALKGHSVSNTTKDRISKANKGKTPWNKVGVSCYSDKALANIKAAAKNRKQRDVSGKNNPMYGRTGKKHPRWNPNLTDEERLVKRRYPKYIDWRNKVFERDNYTCMCCGDATGGNLTAHHKESYNSAPELRTTLENGITLCEYCHKNFHHQFGYGNNTKKQFYYWLLENQKV